MGDSNPETKSLVGSIESGYEKRDLPISGIFKFGVGLGVMMAIVLGVVTVTLALMSGRGINLQWPPLNLANAPAPSLPPEPRLEQVPGQQLREFRANEDEILHSYGWIDRQAGSVHIPVERAMQILAQRGLPTRPEGTNKYEDTGQQSPSYSSSGRNQESYP